MDFRFVSHRKEVEEAKELAMLKGLEMIGLQAEGYAKERITALGAIDTGRLRNSITHATEEFDGQASYSDNEGNSYSDGGAHSQPEKNDVHIGTNVEYGPHIEFGTVRMASRPFLRPAFSEHLPEYGKMMRSALKGD